MTRLRKAWRCWAAVTVILRIAVEQARFGSRRRDNEEAQCNAIRSAVRPLWAIGVSVLVLACVPSTALAGQRTSLHAHHRTTRIGKKSGQQSHGTTPASRGTRVDPPRCGRAGHAIHANGEPLALGSGYGTPGGSCSVRALQRRLAATGYVPGPIDGLYGPLTQGAVRRFQGAYGLLVDGIAGSLTLRALAAGARVIDPGAGYASDGSEPVRALQRRLARAGYRPGRVDGLYGPLTEQAVKRFQTAHGLSADGVAGLRTLARLSKSAALHRRPSHHARRKPTRPAPLSPKHHTRRTPARQEPTGQTRPRAERRPSQGPGIGLILLIGLFIVALPLALLEIERRMRGRRLTTSPRPPEHDESDTSPAPAALAATGVPPRNGDTPDEAEPPSEDEPMDRVHLVPAVVSSLEESGAPQEDSDGQRRLIAAANSRSAGTSPARKLPIVVPPTAVTATPLRTWASCSSSGATSKGRKPRTGGPMRLEAPSARSISVVCWPSEETSPGPWRHIGGPPTVVTPVRRSTSERCSPTEGTSSARRPLIARRRTAVAPTPPAGWASCSSGEAMRRALRPSTVAPRNGAIRRRRSTSGGSCWSEVKTGAPRPPSARPPTRETRTRLPTWACCSSSGAMRAVRRPRIVRRTGRAMPSPRSILAACWKTGVT